MRASKYFFAIFFLYIFVSGCGEDTTPTTPNDPPTLTLANPLSDQSITVNKAFTLTIPTSTFAHSQSQPFALSAKFSPDSFGFSFNPNTNTINGTPTSTGSLSVTITAIDSTNNLRAVDTFTIAIAPPPNAIPTINQRIPNQVAVVKQAFVFSVTPTQFFSDADNDTLTFSVAINPTGIFSFNNNMVTGTPTQTATFNVSLTANDGNGGTAHLAFNITVVNSSNSIVVLNPITDLVATQNVLFSTTLSTSTFSHLQAQPFVINVSLSSPSLNLAYNSATNTISGTPSSTGTVVVTVTASDAANMLSAIDTFTISINPTNRNPRVVRSIGNQIASPDRPFSLPITSQIFQDDDGDPISITVGITPSGVFTFSNNTIVGTPTLNGPQSFSVVVTASDGRGGTAEERFTISIPQPASIRSPSLEASDRLYLEIENIGLGTPFKYTITDINNRVLSVTQTATSNDILLNDIDTSGLANGDLSIELTTFNQNEKSRAVTRVYKNADRLRDIALLFFHSRGSTPSFTITSFTNRFSTTTDAPNAANLLKAISLNRENVGNVDSFGWIGIDSAQFSTIVSQLKGTEAWPTNSSIVAMANSGSFNPGNYDIIFAVYDTTNSLINGAADPFRIPVSIGGVDYGRKNVIAIYGSSSSMLSKQCLVTNEDTDRFIDANCLRTSDGRRYAKVDSVLIHEYLHSKGKSGHSTALSCDSTSNPIGGNCRNIFFNPHAVLGSNRLFANALVPKIRHEMGWNSSPNLLILNAIPPDSTEIVTTQVTLFGSNNSSGYSALRINYSRFTADDIWINHLAPSTINYALSNSSFNTTVNGLLLYSGDALLDASPPNVTFTSVFDSSNVDWSNVADDRGIIITPLGIEISNITRLNPESDNDAIRFDLTLRSITRTRTPPRIESLVLPCISRSFSPSNCIVSASSSITRDYLFRTNDIGFPGESRSWTISFPDLPSELIVSATTPSTISPDGNGTFSSPLSLVTYTGAAVSSTITRTFTLRACHVNDATLCLDLPQTIMISPPKI